LPTGSSPGQQRRARVSLTTAPQDAAGEDDRPRRDECCETGVVRLPQIVAVQIFELL